MRYLGLSIAFKMMTRSLISEWFDRECKIFERFPASRVIGNDIPYDIEELNKEFVAWYKEKTFGKMPPNSLFYNEVTKRCKGKEESENDDEYDCYQSRVQPDDHYQ
jgi:hypothetical protein